MYAFYFLEFDGGDVVHADALWQLDAQAPDLVLVGAALIGLVRVTDIGLTFEHITQCAEFSAPIRGDAQEWKPPSLHAHLDLSGNPLGIAPGHQQ